MIAAIGYSGVVDILDRPRVGSLSTVEVCRQADCTYRQLDYWARLGLVEPAVAARGSGSNRRWTYDQAAQARVCTVLASLGCPAPTIGTVITAISRDRGLWSGQVVITWDGHVAPLGGGKGFDGWLVDLAGCRAHVGAQPVPWGD